LIRAVRQRVSIVVLRSLKTDDWISALDELVEKDLGVMHQTHPGRQNNSISFEKAEEPSVELLCDYNITLEDYMRQYNLPNIQT
jgi:hypothetical protein